jgi:hypothetical protein
MEDTIKICVWPSSQWCEESELDEMTHLSDDFARVDVPGDIDIDVYVHNLVKSWYREA